MGRLTKDLELRYSQGGVAFGSFNLAVNRKFKKEGQPDCDFISCKVFGKTAEFMGKYMAKGSQIALEGHIQTGSYDDKEGVKRYTTDVMVDGVYFADSKKPVSGDAHEPVSQQQQQPSDGFYPIGDDELPF